MKGNGHLMPFQGYPVFTTYFTSGTDYQRLANNLIGDLRRLNLRCRVCETPNLGTWFDNISMRPKFLFETLKQIDQPVCWVSADVTIVSEPVMLGLVPADVAAVWPEGQEWPSTHLLYFSSSGRGRRVLQLWEEQTSGRTPDEHGRALFEAVEAAEATALRLQASYGVRLSDKHWRGERVVVHRGVSDELKQSIGGLA